jgi:serine/threonine-protein kinase HipA
MMQVFDVFINGVLAGKIGKPPRRPVVFQLVEEYRRLLRRPVLGQQFVDKPRAKYSGVAEELPSFFANLIPEDGPLKRTIEHSLGFTSRDDLALLVALGEGLPGAVEVRPGVGGANLLDATQPEVTETTPELVEKNSVVFRFSLAGVQMKFSVLLDADKLRLPMRDELGDWIVKFDSVASPNLPANEYAVMQWARRTGFDVPECRLLPITSLPEALLSKVMVGTEVFLIRRYDRLLERRIHQEDFAQVAGLRPDKKYDHWTYEDCAHIVRETCGEAQYEEFIRRLVFMVASGNTDAHLKNWSLLYPDGINAQLTPLYDQVAVIAWPPSESRMRVVWALELNGTKFMEKTDLAAFSQLAQRSGGDPARVEILVRDTLEKIIIAWHTCDIADLLPTGHANAIFQHWRKVPLLRDRAAELKL